MLVVRVGDASQCPAFAVGQAAIAEAASDFVHRRQGVADTQPLARGAQLGVGARRDPMRATGGVVERPLAGQVELDQ
jgi:hypothetical protein